MTEYTVGLLFSPDMKEVVLLKKQRPMWQQGLYNGPGGKVEPDEMAYGCVRREYREETGLDHEDWHLMVRQTIYLEPAKAVRVCYFVAVSERYNQAVTKTAERVQIVSVRDLPTIPTVPDIQWIVPLAKYAMESRRVYEHVEINLCLT